MKITRLNHAGFIVEADGQRLGFDIGDFTGSHAIPSLGKLNGLVVTHQHADHYAEVNVVAAAAPVAAPADVVALLPRGVEAETLRLGETLTLAGFELTPTPADHGPKLTRAIENYGIVIQHKGCRVYFVGDMAVATATPPKGPFSHVLISVDATGFVFDPEQAVAFIHAIGHAGKVTPIHDGDGDEPGPAQRFAELAAGAFQTVLVRPGESIEVSP